MVSEICDAFAATFEQLSADRETDEFEFNWRQPFPDREYQQFKAQIGRNRPNLADSTKNDDPSTPFRPR
jgi:hypothetical protein